MRTRKLVMLAATVGAVVGGLVGALTTALLWEGTPRKLRLEELQVERLHANEATLSTLQADAVDGGKLTVGTIESRDADGRLRFQVRDGNVIAARRIVAGQLHSARLVTSNVLVATNPLEQELGETRILAELAATEDAGAIFVLRSSDAALVKNLGPVQAGFALCLRMDQEGEPLIYAHDISLGAGGVAPIYRTARPATIAEIDPDVALPPTSGLDR